MDADAPDLSRENTRGAPLQPDSSDNGAAPLPNPAPSSVPQLLRELQTSISKTSHLAGELDDAIRANAVAQTGAQDTAPWSLAAPQLRFFLLLLGTAIAALALRLTRLGTLQREIYGDIEIIFSYVSSILLGAWPSYFSLSAGPLYHYVIVPVIAFTGLNYDGIKLASVLVSVGVLLATYALARRLLSDDFALLATFIAGVSSWLLVFSRLGNSQILVPLLTTGALWLALRFAQLGKQRDLLLSAFVAALGLYTYPQSFVLPGVIAATLAGLRLAGNAVSWRAIGRFAAYSVAFAVPFALIVLRDPANFVSGYIGEKISTASPMSTLFQNVINAALALHVRGDGGQRSNPIGQPHLDLLSGLLFLGGVVFWLLPVRRRWAPALLVPFVLLQVPSVLVLSNAREIPSASRTLGVAPIAYILAASGLWWLLQLLRRARGRWLAPAVATALLGAVLALNVQRYFLDYINGLPYGNTALGSSLADYANMLPQGTKVYVAGCCWEGGMPEPKFARLGMARPQELLELAPDALTCEQLQLLAQPAVLVWSFRESVPSPQVEPCKQWLAPQLYASETGNPLFYAAPLRIDGAPPATSPPASSDADLVSERAQVGGAQVEVRHSPIDMGSMPDLFDGSPETLVRGAEANPLVLELRFSEPRELRALELNLGTMRTFSVSVSLTLADGTAAEFGQQFDNSPSDPQITLDVPGGPRRATTARIAIQNLGPRPGGGFHIHVRGVAVR